MSGCLEDCALPECCSSERRNAIASVAGGVLFFAGWWVMIDAACYYPEPYDLNHAFFTPGVISTVAAFMINAISNAAVKGDSFRTGCMGTTGARVWLFFGFLFGFGALIAGFWILIQAYVVEKPGLDQYPGVAIFLQNALIFFGGVVFKFGRKEDSSF